MEFVVMFAKLMGGFLLIIGSVALAIWLVIKAILAIDSYNKKIKEIRRGGIFNQITFVLVFLASVMLNFYLFFSKLLDVSFPPNTEWEVILVFVIVLIICLVINILIFHEEGVGVTAVQTIVSLAVTSFALFLLLVIEGTKKEKK